MTNSTDYTRILVALCVLAGIGCGTGDQPSDTATPDTGAVMGAMAGGGDTTGAAGGGMTHVSLTEWTIAIPGDTIDAGMVMYHVVNDGQVEHVLEIEGGGSEWKTPNIPSGGNATLHTDLTPGTYDVYCPIEDAHGKHADLGMRTTLVVR